MSVAARVAEEMSVKLGNEVKINNIEKIIVKLNFLYLTLFVGRLQYTF